MMKLSEWVGEMGTVCNEACYHSFDYDVGEKIGSGGECVIYKAKKPGDLHTYAIRIPKKALEDGWRPGSLESFSFTCDKSYLDRFKEEMGIWAKAFESCPEYVVEPTDCNVFPFPWCVMELGECTLRQVLDGGEQSMGLEDFLALFSDLLYSLNAIHVSSGIVHRDIKPENILLVNGKWKFIDFGMAGYDKTSRRDFGIQGSGDYMSPEEARGDKHLGISSDIWAMGIILYKFVTGIKEPYPDATKMTLLTEISKGPNGLRRGYPTPLMKGLDDIIRRALAISPRDRYAHASDFADDLRSATVSDYYHNAVNAFTGNNHDGTYSEPDYKKAYELCLKGEAESIECAILKCIIMSKGLFVPEGTSLDEAMDDAELFYRNINHKIPSDFFLKSDADLLWMGGLVCQIGLGMAESDDKNAMIYFLKSAEKNSEVGAYLTYLADPDKYGKLLRFSAKRGYMPAIRLSQSKKEKRTEPIDVFREETVLDVTSRHDDSHNECVTPTSDVSTSNFRTTTLSKCKKQAMSGDVGAMLELAYRYDNGKGVPKSKANADYWRMRAEYRKLSRSTGVLDNKRSGNNDNQFIPIPPMPYSGSVEKCKKDANLGNVNAMLALVRRYAYGEGVPKSKANADYWRMRAEYCEMHDSNRSLFGNDDSSIVAQGLFEEALKREKGEGVAKDVNKAVELYQKAADLGLESAQYRLGEMYYFGEGVPKDNISAGALFQKAADQGNARAAYLLGLMYRGGEGVPQDNSKAVELYRKAADQGYAEALFILGLLYECGDGVSQDMSKAVELYRKAADQGHVESKKRLSVLSTNNPYEQSNTELFAWAKHEGEKKNKRRFHFFK